MDYKRTFVVRGKTFEVREVDAYATVILMHGKPRPKVLCHNVDMNITVEQAEWFVKGYLQGHTDGQRQVSSIISNACRDVIGICDQHTKDQLECMEIEKEPQQ